MPRFKTEELLAKHTTYRIGGKAAYFAEPANNHELAITLAVARSNALRSCFIGGGSNVLFSDRGFDGLVVHLTGDFREFHFTGKRLFAGAACPMSVLVNQSAEGGLSGLEGLAGVPGTFGGALVGNAGTAGGWIGDIVESVAVLNNHGRVEDLSLEEISFGYRSSSLEGKALISAVLSLKTADKNDILKALSKNLIYRQGTQPTGTLNAGSVFKNPQGKSAGALIEAAGLKGYTVGGAQISHKHANFIINTGSAKASDVAALIEIVRDKVRAESGIALETEIKIIEA